MQKGVRIESSGLKKDPLDFALWKKSKPNEPKWDAVLEIEVSDEEYGKLVKDAVQNNDEDFIKLNKLGKF